jgi:hypothetical protein
MEQTAKTPSKIAFNHATDFYQHLAISIDLGRQGERNGCLKMMKISLRDAT